VAFVLLALAPLGCGPAEVSSTGENRLGEASLALSIPAKGDVTTFDVGSWNLEWFGATGNGPTDKELQLANVRDVMAGTDLDVWGVQEVVSATEFSQLVAGMPGYTGLLATDVPGGTSYYTSGEQKVAIVYRASAVTVKSAQLICTANDYDFGGRPPLEAKLEVTVNGATQTIYFITLHAKAMSDATSYDRRTRASAALKSYLDTTHPNDLVVVAGDFNDDVDVSIYAKLVSPYQNFVDDPADWTFLTKPLSDQGVRSTSSGTHMIDHHLVSNEVVPLYIPGTAEVYRVDQYVPSYSTTTSDHYPVLTRYTFGSGGTGSGSGGGSSPPELILNEILANEPGSDTSGEFVEIVNVGGSSADLGGYTLWDGAQARHSFPTGTSLAAGKAIVVFAGASGIPAGLTNAVTASTGSLSLANSGDTVTLEDATGAVVDSYTYTSTLGSVDGVSMNRNPDATAGAGFVLHTSISTLSSSPGKHADGSAF
jgi:endonuclease/exonuclease/phosphatase family metal-dependent hydrolase